MSIEMLQMLKRDELYFRATKAMDGEDAKSPVMIMGEPQPFPETPNPIPQLGFGVSGQPSIEDINNWTLAYQDKQAFDKLYDDRLEILAILHSALRGGKERYKRALHEIMEICQRME